MRRKDREMDRAFALKITDKCEYAVLSMVDHEGMPYCVPLSMVRDGNSLYFHCAMEGYKVNCLRKNPNVCVTCVGDVTRRESEFTTEFESAILRGVAEEVTELSEKVTALRLICEKYAPTNLQNFETAKEQSVARTAIWQIHITDATGKRKKYDAEGKEMKFGRME